MRSYLLICLMMFCLAGVLGAAAAPAAPPPDHRVVAMYFHRTQRCPTCKKIGTYSEEAIRSGFAAELATGQVAFHLIDFQDAKNARFAESYRITGPTLVLADVKGGKVSQWKPLPKVWSLVGKKDAFFEYVQRAVRDYLEGE